MSKPLPTIFKQLSKKQVIKPPVMIIADRIMFSPRHNAMVELGKEKTRPDDIFFLIVKTGIETYRCRVTRKQFNRFFADVAKFGAPNIRF